MEMERVKEILETYFEHTDDEMWEGYAWDECHKIYLLDIPSAARMRELGYDVVLFRDVETAVNELAEWFKLSCSLRFINAIRGGGDDNRDYEDVISQFQLEEDFVPWNPDPR